MAPFSDEEGALKDEKQPLLQGMIKRFSNRFSTRLEEEDETKEDRPFEEEVVQNNLPNDGEYISLSTSIDLGTRVRSRARTATDRAGAGSYQRGDHFENFDEVT
mgnify:CR=1 FL=1|tara:strand:- start:425 stop:736 length:312 start_codon:yes stop_codon:yes gene_type:complete